MSRAQASVELLVVLSVVIAILSLMGLFVYQKYVRGSELKILVHGDRVINTVAVNVNEISTVGSGYSQYFSLPESLYGSRDYTINFFENESFVYLKGGSFLRGVELHWSAPISTMEVSCLRSECNSVCNASSKEICLKVNGSMVVRVTNDKGVVYLTYPYNIIQNDTGHFVTPILGNITYTNESCPQGSFIYIYRNVVDDSMNLVLKHNSTSGGKLKLKFTDVLGDLNVTVSDNPGEFLLSESEWELKADECSGGVVSFKRGIHLCITPERVDLPWVWLNGDGTSIILDNSGELCVSYP